MKQMIDMMITMSLPALDSGVLWRDTANRWVSFWLHTPLFIRYFQVSCSSPCKIPHSPNLSSISQIVFYLGVFSNPVLPTSWAFPLLFILPSAKFWTPNNPSTDCLCWLRFKWDESNINSLLALASSLHQPSAGCAVTVRSFRKLKCKCHHSYC